MILTEPVHFEGSKGTAEFIVLFDSGASHSLIRADLVPALEESHPLPRVLPAETASAGHYLQIDRVVRLEFYLNELRMSDEFLVVPSLSEEVIIGALTMQKWRIKPDFEHDQIVTDPRVARVAII